MSRAVPRAIPISLGATAEVTFPAIPPLRITYLLHLNHSCWLPPPPPPPPLGVGAGGLGPRPAGEQQQTLGNRDPVGGPLGPPWLQLLNSPQLPLLSPLAVGRWPLYRRGHSEPPLQGRWGEGGKEAAESLCHNDSSDKCCSITASDGHLLCTRCLASFVPESPTALQWGTVTSSGQGGHIMPFTGSQKVAFVKATQGRLAKMQVPRLHLESAGPVVGPWNLCFITSSMSKTDLTESPHWYGL